VGLAAGVDLISTGMARLKLFKTAPKEKDYANKLDEVSKEARKQQLK
jgi:hypothetical protein